VQNVWQLASATGAQWLFAGLCLGIVGAIAGSQAADEQRGRVFGILGMMINLGSLIGGFSFGRMVDDWGYAGMSTAAALFLPIIPA
jgi:MFS family permease